MLGRSDRGRGTLAHSRSNPADATQCAFVRLAIIQIELDHAKRARPTGIATAIADVLLNHNRPELGAEPSAGWARLQAAGVS